MERSDNDPANEEVQSDFVSVSLGKALKGSLDAIQEQMDRVTRAEHDREKALGLLQKVARKGNIGNTATRGRAHDPKEWRPLFLAALRMIPNVRLACDAACISAKSAYAHRNTDAAFREQWDAAERDGVALLHATAFHRAVIGNLEPIYQGGMRVGYRRQYSDRMLELLLKAHLPAMFRESHQVEMQVSGKVKVETTTPKEVLDITQALLPKLAARIHGAQ